MVTPGPTVDKAGGVHGDDCTNSLWTRRHAVNGSEGAGFVAFHHAYEIARRGLCISSLATARESRCKAGGAMQQHHQDGCQGEHGAKKQGD